MNIISCQNMEISVLQFTSCQIILTLKGKEILCSGNSFLDYFGNMLSEYQELLINPTYWS